MMETIILQPSALSTAPKPTTLILGFFDGVHLGHQMVIAEGLNIAREHHENLAVLSFDRHPSQLFQPDKPNFYLTNNEQKATLFKQLGVEYFYIVPFTREFASLSPSEFVENYVVKLGAKHIIVGFDYCFGYQAKGNVDTLKTLSQGRFEVHCIDKIECRTEKISSTAIRQALQQGDVAKVNRLLGRAYETTGVVVHGDARGRTIGFPTANIKWDKGQFLPMESVYVVEMLVKGEWLKGMASIGRNITFEKNRDITVEVNLFDFNDDIYDEQVTIRWWKRLRKELKFNHVDALVRQLQQDKYHSVQFFEEKANEK